jgi:hypothetical protein
VQPVFIYTHYAPLFLSPNEQFQDRISFQQSLLLTTIRLKNEFIIPANLIYIVETASVLFESLDNSLYPTSSFPI